MHTYIVITRCEIEADSCEQATSGKGHTKIILTKCFPKTNVEAIKSEQWPTVLKPLKLLSQPGDRGAGDIIARLIPGGDGFKEWSKKVGWDCGCDDRQKAWNKKWPL